jgi:hypothetical protein
MRIWLAGSAPRMGRALGDALARRGHVVVLVGGDCDGVVICGDARDEAADMEQTLAAVDAVAGSKRHPPIVRVSTLGGDAGAESEPVVLRAGRAQLRDLPRGIPESRTASALLPPDLALLEACAARELAGVILRTAELLSPLRTSFDPADVVSRTIRAAKAAAPLDPRSTLEVLDADTLAQALEAIVAAAESVAGEALHAGGGPGSRISFGELLEAIGLELSSSPAPLRVHALDDDRTRRRLAFSAGTDALAAIQHLASSLPSPANV